MIRALVLTLALLGAACAKTETVDQTQTPPPVTAEPGTADEATAEDTCGMARFQHLIGTLASEIDQASLPPRTRIITPDSMVTQDFSPQRLNILTGTDGRVSSMRCF